jgi:carbon monoxide dehydrogenase subunit G
MNLEQSFTVAAPLDQVWEALIDVERVAPCLPGAEITGKDDEGNYQGTFVVKLGPTTANYRGGLKMESLDEATHTAVMSAKGTDKRGQGGATATITSTMKQEGAATRVEVNTDFAITGRLARFGRGGMIEDISKRMLRDFGNCLQETLAQESPEAAAEPAPDTVEPAAAGAVAAAAPADGPGAAPPPPTPSPATPPPPPRAPAKPVNGLSLFFSVLLERIKRLFGRG